jgi:hypothetical protein
MILGLVARIAGPAATLILLAALAAWPAEYIATYAVLAAYLQLATAPLNPYAEHFHLREMLNGRSSVLGAGLVALGLMWLAALALVWFMGHTWLILAIFPVLGLGHLLLKVRAARLRADHRNTLAIALEFSFRPLMLLVGTLAVFAVFGASDMGLEVVFGLTGLATIAVSLMLGRAARRTAGADTALNTVPDINTDTAQKTNGQASTFLFLGTLMVLATQFEIFALDKVGTAAELGTYKVALQLASVCGIATNFVLIGKLRALYANPIGSDAYRATFRGIQVLTLGISLIFMLAFGAVALVWPLIWSQQTWLLAAAAAAIYAVTAAFGPLSNWFYAAGRVRVVIASLLVMLAVKLILFTFLMLAHVVSPGALIGVYGAGMIANSSVLLLFKRRSLMPIRLGSL